MVTVMTFGWVGLHRSVRNPVRLTNIPAEVIPGARLASRPPTAQSRLSLGLVTGDSGPATTQDSTSNDTRALTASSVASNSTDGRRDHPEHPRSSVASSSNEGDSVDALYHPISSSSASNNNSKHLSPHCLISSQHWQRQRHRPPEAPKLVCCEQQQ